MNTLRCHVTILTRTLGIMKGAGKSKKERGAYWLADPRRPEFVVEVYEPAQETTRVLFWLSPESVRALMSYLKQKRLMLCAQVHTHPGLAFHSETDDQNSLLGKIGSESIVVPNFAKGVTIKTFVEKSAFFYLLASGEWIEATNEQVRANFKIFAL